MMNNNDWINNLKVGDKVAICERFSTSIGEVTAINKATIKVSNKLFNKNNGVLRGKDIWTRCFITELTDEIKTEIDFQKAKNLLRLKLNKLDVNSLNFSQTIDFIKFINNLTTPKTEE